MEQYAEDHPDAYFWFDLFTNNQNEVANKDFDWFCSTFRNGIVNIGQVLLVLSPWDDPKPIKRCWCLFEIFNSLEESEVKFSINLPRAEVAELKSGIIKDAGCVIQALSDIQAEKAEAKSELDKEMIFDVIKGEYMGGAAKRARRETPLTGPTELDPSCRGSLARAMALDAV